MVGGGWPGSWGAGESDWWCGHRVGGPRGFGGGWPGGWGPDETWGESVQMTG